MQGRKNEANGDRATIYEILTKRKKREKENLAASSSSMFWVAKLGLLDKH
jgi:hypothetical protein